MVGDRLDTDILGGNQSGMKTVYLKKGKYGGATAGTQGETPDYEVDDFSQITNILDKDK